MVVRETSRSHRKKVHITPSSTDKDEMLSWNGFFEIQTSHWKASRSDVLSLATFVSIRPDLSDDGWIQFALVTDICPDLSNDSLIRLALAIDISSGCREVTKKAYKRHIIGGSSHSIWLRNSLENMKML